jgi:hypothetical protein
MLSLEDDVPAVVTPERGSEIGLRGSEIAIINV